MKFAGQEINIPNIRTIVIRRPTGEKFEFTLGPADIDKFNEVLPPPKPRIMTKAGGEKVELRNESKFKEEEKKHDDYRSQWVLLESLKYTKELEFETVKEDDPETWQNWREEFKKAGFTFMEIGRIMQEAMLANSITEEAIEEAEKDFLPGGQAQDTNE